MMKTMILGGALGAVVATGALSQQAPTILTYAPVIEGSACVYAGLVYSPQALLTVDIPFRRESPQATQKQLLVCELLEDGENWGWVPQKME